jgi:hypothetical protein
MSDALLRSWAEHVVATTKNQTQEGLLRELKEIDIDEGKNHLVRIKTRWCLGDAVPLSFDDFHKLHQLGLSIKGKYQIVIDDETEVEIATEIQQLFEERTEPLIDYLQRCRREGLDPFVYTHVRGFDQFPNSEGTVIVEFLPDISD